MNSALLNRRAFLKSFLRRWRRLSSLLSSRARESVHCRGSSGRTAAARPCLPASRLRPRGRQRHRHHHGQKSGNRARRQNQPAYAQRRRAGCRLEGRPHSGRRQPQHRHRQIALQHRLQSSRHVVCRLRQMPRLCGQVRHAATRFPGSFNLSPTNSRKPPEKILSNSVWVFSASRPSPIPTRSPIPSRAT